MTTFHILALAATSLVAYPSCNAAARSEIMFTAEPMPPVQRLLALGDSYTIGEGVADDDRWPAQLATLLAEQGLVLRPTYIARTGWTTGDLAAALDAAHPGGPFDAVSLMVGVNNQYRDRGTGDYRSGFRDLLKRAVALAGNRPDHVVVLSIPDWSVTPFAATRDRSTVAHEIDAFNAINRGETAALHAHYVDVTPISREAADRDDLLAPDGLHPSGHMYRRWARLVAPIVAGMLRP